MHTRTQRRVGVLALHATLIPLAIITLVPFAWLLLASFKTAEDFSGSLFLPVQAEIVADADGVVERVARLVVPAARDGSRPEWRGFELVLREPDGDTRAYRFRNDHRLRVAEGESVSRGQVLSPRFVDLTRFTFTNYWRLFTEIGIGNAVINSFFLASVTALLATLFSAAGGYALARFRFPGRTLVTFLVLGALIIPPSLLLAPTYELLYHLSLLDTFTGLILPAVAPAFGLFLFRQATLQSVPVQLIEAARIDGASELGIFVRMVLPLVRPMIGAFMLITFLATWNNFIGPQVVLQSAQKYPLSVAVAQLRGLYQQEYGMLMAGTVVSVVPIALLFLALQREFISGLTSGAVKG